MTAASKPLKLLLLACLGLNAIILGMTALERPEYLRDHALSEMPDARHYVKLGRNLLIDGHYSRSDGPVYRPDVMRTPVYPVVAGGLEILGGPLLIYLFQIGLHLALCVVTYRLGRDLYGPTVGLWASFFVSTDLMLAIFNFSAMSELLFVVLLTWAASLFLRLLASMEGRVAQVYSSALVVGTVLGLAILTRPTAKYVPVVLAAVLIWYGLRRRLASQALRATALLLVPVVIVSGLWIARNYSVFSVARLTTVDSIATVYTAGAGAYQVKHGVSRKVAREMIAQEFDLPSFRVVNNPWLAEESDAALDRQLRSATPEILMKYPRALLVSSALGIVKASVAHATPLLARQLNRRWIGSDDAPAGDRGVGWRLSVNGPLLYGAFVWQIGHSMLVLGLALVGVLTLLAHKDSRQVTLIVLLLLAYFYAVVALYGIDATFRARIPVLPALYLFAAAGIDRLFRIAKGAGGS